jgi:electron transfer flavoprotein beta subunit
MRKILVPIKRVPDYEAVIKIEEDGKGIIRDGIKWIINPFDEIAVEEAIRLKEKSSEEILVEVVSIGPTDTTEQIRTALAMGADSGKLIICDDYIDSDAAHRILIEIYKKDSYSMIIMGKQAIDSDANQTGQLIAAGLGIAQATFASKLEVDDSWAEATVTREVDGGLETIKVSLPAVITTDLRLNEPRYPSLPGIVKAKKKPLEEIPISTLNVDISPKIRILKMEAPKERQAGIRVENVAELVSKLKNEAKVI